MGAPSRRRFLKGAVGSAAVLTVPGWARSAVGMEAARPAAREADGDAGMARLAARAATATAQDEEFWELVKGQFPLAPGLILMNAANLCPSPYSVQEAVFRLTRDVDGDASFQNRAKFDRLREESRSALAGYLGAGPDEIAITRNTSESNNTVLNGLTLGPGDEVVVWDQNHPTNNISWDVRAERWGFTVKRVSTPPRPSTEEELLAPFFDAVTARTRVLAVTHISNASGVALPVAALCGRAKEAGILTLVDGAQSFGAIRVDLHEMGCDYYTGSAHKWFVGPKEAGVLYVRRDRVADLWASDVGVGWRSALEGGARKFDNLGQRDDAAVAAVATAARFHEVIGPELIEARVRALVDAIKRRVREISPDARFHTSDVPALGAGVVVIQFPIADHRPLYDRLYEGHRVAGALRGGEHAGIRLCPHIYNTMAEVDRAVEAFAAELA